MVSPDRGHSLDRASARRQRECAPRPLPCPASAEELGGLIGWPSRDSALVVRDGDRATVQRLPVRARRHALHGHRAHLDLASGLFVHAPTKGWPRALRLCSRRRPTGRRGRLCKPIPPDGMWMISIGSRSLARTGSAPSATTRRAFRTVWPRHHDDAVGPPVGTSVIEHVRPVACAAASTGRVGAACTALDGYPMSGHGGPGTSCPSRLLNWPPSAPTPQPARS